MTSAVLSAAEQAAIPSALVAVQALSQFVTDLGTDPTQVAVKFPGALLKLQGTVELQLPTLATSEYAAATSAIQSVFSGWVSKLQAAQKAA